MRRVWSDPRFVMWEGRDVMQAMLKLIGQSERAWQLYFKVVVVIDVVAVVK